MSSTLEFGITKEQQSTCIQDTSQTIHQLIALHMALLPVADNAVTIIGDVSRNWRPCNTSIVIITHTASGYQRMNSTV